MVQICTGCTVGPKLRRIRLRVQPTVSYWTAVPESNPGKSASILEHLRRSRLPQGAGGVGGRRRSSFASGAAGEPLQAGAVLVILVICLQKALLLSRSLQLAS